MTNIIKNIYTFTTDCIDTMHQDKRTYAYASAFANDYSYSKYPGLDSTKRAEILKAVDNMLREDYE